MHEHEHEVRIVGEQIIAHEHFPLTKVTFEQPGRDGRPQRLTREVYDSASGAAVLPYERAHRRVVLTRQFRIGARLNGHDGWMLEAAAGMLDDAAPEQRVRCEALEEAGYALTHVEPALRMFPSPGVSTERVHLFVAEVERGRQRAAGGGLADEGENIEVVELGFDDAQAMIETGDINDARTVILLLHLERRVLGRHGEAS